MGIKTVAQPPYSPDLGPCDFWLFPKLRGCRYETIEEMKEAATKVIDTLTQEDFDGAFRSCCNGTTSALPVEGDYFEWDKSFTCVLSIKVPIRKKSGNLINDRRTNCEDKWSFGLRSVWWIAIYDCYVGWWFFVEFLFTRLFCSGWSKSRLFFCFPCRFPTSL